MFRSSTVLLTVALTLFSTSAEIFVYSVLNYTFKYGHNHYFVSVFQHFQTG